MPRLQRLTDFIARLLGKEWDVRALDHQRGIQQSHRQSPQQESPTAPDDAGTPGRTEESGAPRASGASAGSPAPTSSADSADSPAPAVTEDSANPSGRTSDRAKAAASTEAFDASRTWPSRSGRPDEHASGECDVAGRSLGAEPTDEATDPLTLARIESMLTGPMDYNVQLADDREHPCLLGTWDSFPFVIEIPEGHDGWLLVSGDWEEAAPASQRDEIAASVNDWNRDKFFPTVGVIDTPIGPLVRATYLTDLSAGATDAQLRLHLDTALSACTQALSLVGPLLPEI